MNFVLFLCLQYDIYMSHNPPVLFLKNRQQSIRQYFYTENVDGVLVEYIINIIKSYKAFDRDFNHNYYDSCFVEKQEIGGYQYFLYNNLCYDDEFEFDNHSAVYKMIRYYI